jgi:F420-dependent oxidoreductase-like protein
MIEGQEGVSWDQWVALAEACERAGLEALFRSDHYLSGVAPERTAHDAWTTLAGLAARTTTLRLGTLVSPVTFRHPSLLANAVATVDHISGGRVELGLGAGWMTQEHEAYGFSFPPLRERLARLAEQLEVVHRLWTEERVDFDGTYYTLRDCPGVPKPVQRPRPPILVGGRAKPGTVGAAVRFADEYNLIGSSLEEYAGARGRLDEACERAGRDPKTLRLSVMTGFAIGPDRDAVREHARRTLERWGSDAAPEDAVARFEARGTAGTPEEFVAGLQELEAAGVERIMLQHASHDDLETIELIGRDVVPNVA